jgi:hypothetical protein
MILTIDDRDGIHNMDVEASISDDRSALDWLLKLDGKKHTLLSIERGDGWQLMIGGGASRYIITLGNGEENLTFKNSLGDESSMVELCAGGQFGEYPESLCANYDQAAHVVSLFLNGQERLIEWV